MGAITMLEKNWGLPTKYVPSSKCYKARATSKYHYFGTKGKTLCGKFDMKIYKPNYFTGTKADLEELIRDDQVCERCYKIMQQTRADLELALELSTLATSPTKNRALTPYFCSLSIKAHSSPLNDVSFKT